MKKITRSQQRQNRENAVIAVMVNNTLDFIKEKLESFSTTLGDREGQLLKMLKQGQLYYCSGIAGQGAGDLYETLRPFMGMKENLSQYTSFNFDHFVNLLFRLVKYEVGGIDLLNDTLADTLRPAQEPGHSEEGLVAYCGQLNDQLYAAQFLFPHIFGRVEVQLHPSNTMMYEDFQEKFALMHRGHRHLHLDLSRLMGRHLFHFDLPLPHTRNFGPSIYRGPYRNSDRPSEPVMGDIFFTTKRRAVDNRMVPVLAVALGTWYEYTYFDIGEIGSVKFSRQTRLTPMYCNDFDPEIKDHAEKLHPRRNHVAQYLLFRHFGINPRVDRVEHCAKYRNKVEKMIIWDSLWCSNEDLLWKKNNKLTKLECGFFAVSADRPEFTSLVELENIDFGQTEEDSIAPVYHHRVMHQHRNRKGIAGEYTGRNVIERLMTVPYT